LTRPRASAPHTTPVLLDTGVLVAVFDRLDAHHDVASNWMAGNREPLLTVAPVLSEAAFFLPARRRGALAGLVARGLIEVRHPDMLGYARIALLFDKYADLNPDWADLELVWLAESAGVNRIATFDTDFNTYRIHGRKRFELELLR
jgi:uncharacterized protein